MTDPGFESEWSGANDDDEDDDEDIIFPHFDKLLKRHSIGAYSRKFYFHNDIYIYIKKKDLRKKINQ